MGVSGTVLEMTYHVECGKIIWEVYMITFLKNLTRMFSSGWGKWVEVSAPLARFIIKSKVYDNYDDDVITDPAYSSIPENIFHEPGLDD
jgi:hypothetical protein